MYSPGCTTCAHKDQIIGSLQKQVYDLQARLAVHEAPHQPAAPPQHQHGGVHLPHMPHPLHLHQHQHQHHHGQPAPSLPPSHSPHGGSAAYPFPQHVQYAPGTTKPNHVSQDHLDRDVRAFYDHWKGKYLQEAGHSNSNGKTRYRVIMNNNGNASVSEGQGFGMIIVAMMAGYEAKAREIFDGLFLYCKDYPSSINARNMAWKVNADGSRGGDNSAFDGDADITYGLILADKQWGSTGAVDYRAEALAKLEAMASSMIGPDSKLPLLGDWVQPNSTDKFSQWSTRPSDFMYGHFQAFAQFDQQRRHLWESVLSATQAVANQVQRDHASRTGLLPDFVQYDRGCGSYKPAQSGFLEGNNDGAYFYNAGRIPWRFGVHALLHGDAVAAQQAERILRWVASQGTIKAGYHLDGRPIGDYFSTFFASPFVVAAMVAPSAQSWLNKMYDAIKHKKENYYEDCVNMLCLLTLSGNFWDPTTIGTGSVPKAIATGHVSVAEPIQMSAAPASSSSSSTHSGDGPVAVRGSAGTEFTFLPGSNKWWLGISIPGSQAVKIDSGNGRGWREMVTGWAPGIWTYQCEGAPCGSTLRFIVNNGRQEETVACPY